MRMMARGRSWPVRFSTPTMRLVCWLHSRYWNGSRRASYLRRFVSLHKFFISPWLFPNMGNKLQLLQRFLFSKLQNFNNWLEHQLLRQRHENPDFQSLVISTCGWMATDCGLSVPVFLLCWWWHNNVIFQFYLSQGAIQRGLRKLTFTTEDLSSPKLQSTQSIRHLSGFVASSCKVYTQKPPLPDLSTWKEDNGASLTRQLLLQLRSIFSNY